MSEEMLSFAPDQDRERDLRRAFARFGTGVTVVSVSSAIGPLGMTANSFTSVSLNPPLVLWSPAKSSRRHDSFIHAERFCVHVLSVDQLPLALHFASKGEGFDQWGWEMSPESVPVLQNCLSVFHCRTRAVHPAGDHSIVLAEVVRVELSNTPRPGLIFADGHYGSAQPFETDQ